MADNKTYTSGPLHVSRLIQHLQQLHISHQPVAPYNVAEKLGGLIDLSLSVGLSNTLGGLARISGGDNIAARDYLRAELLKERETWVTRLVAACDPAKPAGVIALPRLSPDYASDIDEAAQPFARFYAVQQSELEHHISGLQRRVRDTLSESSPDMARLATLDRTLFDILAKQTRRAFGVLPPLIAKHFAWHCARAGDEQGTLAQYPEGNPQPAWLRHFIKDLRDILLAELDIRLQPVIGLIEAREATTGL